MMHSIFTVSILWPHAITAPYCVSLYSACSTGLGNTEHYVHTLHYLLLFCGGPMQNVIALLSWDMFPLNLGQAASTVFQVCCLSRPGIEPTNIGGACSITDAIQPQHSPM